MCMCTLCYEYTTEVRKVKTIPFQEVDLAQVIRFYNICFISILLRISQFSSAFKYQVLLVQNYQLVFQMQSKINLLPLGFALCPSDMCIFQQGEVEGDCYDSCYLDKFCSYGATYLKHSRRAWRDFYDHLLPLK